MSLVVMLTTALFMTQLYIEEFWWMLTLPVCLLRAAELEYARTRELATEHEDDTAEPVEEPDPAAGQPGTIGWT